MFAMNHNLLMALHEDRLREVERSARAAKARRSGRLQHSRLRKVLGLSAGPATYLRPAPHPVQTPRSITFATATTSGYADACRQN
jgi:hypothetical protein